MPVFFQSSLQPLTRVRKMGGYSSEMVLFLYSHHGDSEHTEHFNPLPRGSLCGLGVSVVDSSFNFVHLLTVILVTYRTRLPMLGELAL